MFGLAPTQGFSLFYSLGGLVQPAHQVAHAEFRWLLAAGADVPRAAPAVV
jgi:hypothetical protein